MSFKVQRFIRDEIVIQHLNHFLKQNNIPIKKKIPDTISYLEECVNNNINGLNETIVNGFIKDTIKYGSRRFLYITKFKKHDIKKMQSLKNIHEAINYIDASIQLEENHLNILNDINSNLLVDKEIDKDYIEFINLEVDEEQKNVEYIELCISSFNKNVDGGIIFDSKTYIWIEINIREQVICFRVPSSTYHFGEPSLSNQTFNYYLELLKEAFGINFEDMNTYKEILYNISKDIFEIAEKPFLERFNASQLSIERMLKLADRNGLFDKKASYDLFSGRLEDLIQRIIIQENFDEYMSHAEGKDGIITKLEFTDPTGASVRANAGTKKDGTLESCDIFFDTRKTLSEESTIDQVIIEWFLPHTISTADRVSCRFFVANKFLAVNFQFVKLNREVEAYVFSKLKQYQGFEWYR